ncbi:dipeptidase PepV [Fructilactobacillus florum]|uniref:dipeptidase PepV n=1 Tax=Fructilactobacillus florum TaxID=640331 RepID=UPI00058FC9A8|nr:dipeptidase PepV [Fructilactobacillus florum]
MKMDWKAAAAALQPEYLADLKKLVAIDSSRDVEHQTDEFPLGPGPAHALQQFLAFGERDGFVTKNIDNIVGYIEYGSGSEYFAVLGHADTVPAGKGWTTDPFKLEVSGDNLIGRGTSDDKGPALAAYYAMRILKANGIHPMRKIRLVIGTDEETNWTGMKRYFETQPAPCGGFSPDAEFPLINGEKGNTSFEIKFPQTQDSVVSQLKSFQAGLKENMVPRDATAVLTSDEPQTVVKAFNDFLQTVPVTGSSETESNLIRLAIVGKAAHGMEPKNGLNAGTYLSSFLASQSLDPVGQKFVTFIAQKLHDDSRAVKLGLNFTDEVMGDLTMNVGQMQYTNDTGGLINTNFRYPQGVDPNRIAQQLQAATATATVRQISNMQPHFVAIDDPLVESLMEVYRKQTGRYHDQPEVVGGGTYARLMEHGVAFGALLPTTTDTMHQANEFQPQSDLLLAMSIYAEALATVTDK